MKRRFTILTAVFALLAFLAIPMGMWGQTTYEQLTSIANIDESAQYVLGIDETGFHYEGTSSWGKTALPSAQTPIYYTLTKATDGNSFTAHATISGTTYYLQIPTSNTFSMATSTGTNTDIIIGTTQVSGTNYAVANKTTTARHLRINGTSGLRSYAGTTGTMAFFYKVVTSSSNTYTVTFDAGEGTFVASNDLPYESNTVVAGTYILPHAIRDGYTFNGWALGESTYEGGATYTVNADADFVATYTENSGNDDVITATLNIQDYAEANNWTNGTKYTTATVAPVTFTANGGGNTGKYYESGHDWRFYQGESASITISVAEGYTLVSVKPIYTASNNGVLKNGNTTIVSGTTVSVSGTSVTFNVGNSSSATNGQVRFTNIDVTYVSNGGTQTSSDLAIASPTGDLTFDLYNNTTAQVISYTTSSTGAITITPAESSYFTYVHDATAKTITVTPLAVTPSAQTVTIDQEADDNYYGGSASFTVSVVNSDPNAPGTENNPYTVAQARAAIDAGIGTQGVYATGIVSAIPTAWSNDYHNITFNFVDNEGDNDFLQAYRCVSTDNVDASTVAVGDVVVVYGNLTYYASSQTYEFASGCQLVSLTHPVVTTPTVTVTPNTINVPFAGAEGTLTITYENIPELISFDYYFCDPNGGELEDTDPYYPDWIDAEINEENGAYVLSYSIDANQGEARSAYFKVYTTIGDEFNPEEVYAIVTVNQDEYVAPTYAELPFEFNSGKDDIEDTDGLYQNELGADYSANTNPYTRLKFDSTGDWLLLQFDERPGKLTFDIKGNSFSGGTFTVQTSEDGTTYTNLDTYTSFGSDVESKEYDNLGENVRYIKWIYTNKATGNVGLGNIKLAAYEAPALASITITPDNFELDANAHMAEVLTRIAYQNIAIVPGSGNGSFSVQYYDADGQELQQTWCVVGATPVNGSDDEFDLGIVALVNDGTEARTAYFKLYGHDAEDNVVYSNLVTITQAAPVIDYAVLPFVWQGGASADFLALNGVTAHGLGGDYAAGYAPYLIKFDGNGDYIQVKCDQQPGKVTIGVKMIGGGNTSTITIQGSADGETFTDIEELTISGEQNNVLTLETTNVFGENDRYVRMVFTKGSNVGVGPITIEKGNAPSITVTPATIDLAAAGQGTPYQMTQMNVTYSNLEIEDHDDFAVQFYDAEGQEQTQPDWIIMTDGVIGSNEAGYLIAPIIAANQGPARSAYFKVYALGEEDNVYSNLVTINQAGAAVQQYTLTVEPFDNLEIFTFIDDELTEPMEGAGSIQVTEGTSVMLSVSAVDGFVMETLMVNGVNHVNDIAEDLTYTFEMPAEDVTIIATAVENVPSYTLTIDGYQDDNNEGGYYLIASPVTVDLSNHEMTTGDFDLYYFDQAQDDEWRNYEANAFSLEPGKGYLYAHKTGGEFTLTGTPYNGNGVIELDYDSNATDFQGWNLVGNPWGVKAYPNHDFYTMNSDGSGIDVTVYPANTEVAPMTGIFVVAEGEGETVTFAMENSGNKNANLALNLTTNNKLIDRAIVRFGEGRQLPKFQLNPNHTKVYFTMDNKDFALVRSEAQGEMPVSFKAENNGTYTFSVNAEEVNFSYLHLIDNMTGNDIDLLSTPSYSFEATTSDYANRFRLVFSANDTNSENFAFVNNGEIIVTGQGTVQVYDVTGRMISTHNNVNRIATEGMSAGVYMLHLINGSNVKTQKIVVK